MPKTSWSGHRHHSHATDCSRRSRYHRGIIGPNKPKLLYYLTSIKREITEIYREIFISFVRIAYHIYLHLPYTYLPRTYYSRQTRKDYMTRVLVGARRDRFRAYRMRLSRRSRRGTIEPIRIPRRTLQLSPLSA